MSNPTHLPMGDALIVDESKITGYLLAEDHVVGGSKARYFRKRGFTPEAWETFATALREHGQTQTVTATSQNKHGRKYEVQCQLMTPDGRNPCILTGCIQEGNKPPRLVTAYLGK